MIELANVYKSYGKGKITAVSGLSLTVGKGELFGFLGPNGAGKTTTIKMLVGLLKPDSGAIKVGGIDRVSDPLAVKRIIGYVPDESVAYEKMTGAAFLAFIADVFELPEAARHGALDLAGEFEIADALGDVISSYSHGMKQKLSIISALLHDPEVFILDEPIVGLDPKSAFLLKEKMKERCRVGKTVFFSTHVMEVAERLCDRVGIIHHGKMVAVGPLEELKSRSESRPDHGDETLERIFLELTDERL
jgi:ABC-2 type transport system ATP-binding protein